MRNSHWVNPRFRRLLSDSIIFKALFTESIDPVIGTGSGSFTRAGNQVALNESGNYETYSANNPAWAYDTSANFLGVLGEPASTNSLLQSRQFDTTWTASPGTITLTQDQVGIDGVANTAWTAEDDNGAGQEGIEQTVTIPDDSNTHCSSWFLKKDSDETRFPAFRMRLTGGTVKDIEVHVNTKTGASSEAITTGTVSSWVEDHGNFWRVVLTAANDSTGNTNATCYFYAARGTVIGTTSAAATGSCVIDQAQLELNRSTPTSPIYTTTGTVTRSTTYQYPQWPISSEDNIKNAAGVALCSFAYIGSTENNTKYGAQSFIDTGDSGNTEFGLGDSAGTPQVSGRDGTNTVNATGLSATQFTVYSAAMRWNATTGKMQVGYYNGSTWTWGTEGTFDGSFPSMTAIKMGAYGAAVSCAYKKLTIYDSDMTTSEIETAAAAL